jgi:hypothetical protein
MSTLPAPMAGLRIHFAWIGQTGVVRFLKFRKLAPLSRSSPHRSTAIAKQA